MDDKEPRAQRQGISLALGMAAALIFSGALGLYYWQRMDAVPAISTAGFDVARVEERKPSISSFYQPPTLPASSPAPLRGYVPQAVSNSQGGQGAEAPARGYSAGATPAAADREHERQFLMRNGAVLAAYERKLGNIGARYYKQSAVVRDVDRAFMNMSRYMELKRRHESDPNPFQFVRDALSLPEVRAEISKRMADPAVWKVSMGMILEALRDPPPPTLYQEAQRFMTRDPAVIDYLGGFADDVQKNLPAAMTAIPTGGNIAPLQKLIGDIAPTGTPIHSQ